MWEKDTESVILTFFNKELKVEREGLFLYKFDKEYDMQAKFLDQGGKWLKDLYIPISG